MGLWEDIQAANDWGNDVAGGGGRWLDDRRRGAADELDAIGRYVTSQEKSKSKKKPKKKPLGPPAPKMAIGPPPSIDDDQRAYAHGRMQQVPKPPGPEQPYDYFAAADKLLTSMGMGQSASGLADVGSTIASYNQARDAARKNAAVANEQIGVYGQQGQASINESGGQAEASALRNVAAVRGTNAQMQAAPDEGVKRAQDIASAQGIQLSPGILEDAARSKSIAANTAAGIDAGAVGGVTSATQSKNNALQSSANATQGARNITQGNLDGLLAQLGIEEADKVSSQKAGNASAQSAYAAQRAEMLFGLAGQIDPLTGRPRTPEQEAALNQKVSTQTDPQSEVLAELAEYDKKHKIGAEGSKYTTDLSASQIVRLALAGDDPATAEAGALAGLEQVNAEREKAGMGKLSRDWILQRVRRGFRVPANITQTSR